MTVLVHDQSVELLISQLEHELRTVAFVEPVGVGSRHILLYRGLAQQDNAREHHHLRILQQRHMCSLKPLCLNQHVHFCFSHTPSLQHVMVVDRPISHVFVDASEPGTGTTKQAHEPDALNLAACYAVHEPLKR